MAEQNHQFSERLKALVDARPQTQKDFASLVGVQPHTMNNYCKKGRVPEWDILLKVAQALNVSIEYLLTGEGSAGCTFPPMLDGFPQDWISIGPGMLNSLGVDPANLRLFVHREEDVFSPELGVKAGDLVFVDISTTKATRPGLYLVRVSTPDPPRVRHIYNSPEGILEVDDGFQRGKGVTTLERFEVVGKVVGRAGTTV